MRIEADQRRMPAEERPRTHAWLAKRQPVWLDGDLRYAKAFDDIATSRHYKTVDCATLGEYGEALGYDAPQVRRWRDIGFVLRVEHRAERFVREGRVTLEKIVILKEIYAHPECMRPGDDWLKEAQNTRARALRRRIRKRIEEVRQKKTVAHRDLCAPVETWDKFDRMRDLLSAKAKQRLTEGETLDRLTEDGLDKHDPLRKAKKHGEEEVEEGRREDCECSAGSCACLLDKAVREAPVRSPPRALKHAVYRRAEGTCEYPGCRCRTGLQLAHVHPHAAGGPWHVRNVVLLCPAHHTMFDAGRLVFLRLRRRRRAAAVREAGGEPPAGRTRPALSAGWARASRPAPGFRAGCLPHGVDGVPAGCWRGDLRPSPGPAYPLDSGTSVLRGNGGRRLPL